jgi:hypothetical protein
MAQLKRGEKWLGNEGFKAGTISVVALLLAPWRPWRNVAVVRDVCRYLRNDEYRLGEAVVETLRPQSTLVCDESGAVLIEVLPVFLAAVPGGCERL